MNPTRIGILIFAVTALAGPLYTVEGYSSARNLISQLGAQNTQNSYVMVVGFLALGIGIVVDGIRRFSRPVFPFIIFGLCMAIAGIFAHKPLLPDVNYSEGAHRAHSAMATVAGISITVGLIWQALLTLTFLSRVIILALATMCFALPLCMLAFQEFQGLVQRLMYLLLFIWLWIYFPYKIRVNNLSQ